MKKFILVLAMIMLSTSAMAASYSIPNSMPYTSATTLLSAVTTTAAGSAVTLPVPYSQFTCQVVWGGTSPTNTVVRLEGSIDNSTWASLSEVTVLTTGTVWHVINKPVMYIRGNYVSLTGGDGTSTVTMKCLLGGN